MFSLVLDIDVTEDIAFQFPELYRELQKVVCISSPTLSLTLQGRALSFKTFFVWVAKSVYQGGVIMLLAIFLFNQSLYQVISITFTALILTELINVAFEIHTWHWMMIVSEIVTLIIYVVSIAFLPEYFGMPFVSFRFVRAHALTPSRRDVHVDWRVCVENLGDSGRHRHSDLRRQVYSKEVLPRFICQVAVATFFLYVRAMWGRL